MPKQVIAIPGVSAPPSPFNHVVRAGDLLFLSSQLSANLKTHTLIPGDITAQTRQALENIKFLLEVCGASLEDIVKTTVYMRDVRQFEDMNKVYRDYFHKGTEPTRVTIQAPSPLLGIDIEIDAIVYCPVQDKRAG